jgi:hypothetical protein
MGAGFITWLTFYIFYLIYFEIELNKIGSDDYACFLYSSGVSNKVNYFLLVKSALQVVTISFFIDAACRIIKKMDAKLNLQPLALHMGSFLCFVLASILQLTYGFKLQSDLLILEKDLE